MNRQRVIWKPARGFYALVWMWMNHGRTHEVWVGPFETIEAACGAVR